MKKIIVGLLVCAALSTQAIAAGGSQVLSVQSVDVGDGVVVNVPVVKMANGSVCESYVSGVGRKTEEPVRAWWDVLPHAGGLDVQISTICGRQAVSDTTLGVHPENLAGMRTYTNDGLTLQLPTVRLGNTANE
jgi:hypothetical protein